MSGGVEYLFWCGVFAAILILWAIVELCAHDDNDLLPAPRCDCIARGGKDHWLVTDVKTITGE